MLESYWNYNSLSAKEFSNLFLENYDEKDDGILFGNRSYINLQYSFYNHLIDKEELDNIVLSSGVTASSMWEKIKNDFYEWIIA